MKDSGKHIDSIIAKAGSALKKYREKEQEVENLLGELKEIRTLRDTQADRIKELERKLDLAASARKLSGDDSEIIDVKGMTRKQLNAYIREIDRCIDLLSKEEKHVKH